MSVLKGEGSYPILFGTTSVPVHTRTHTVYVARPDMAGAWPTVMVIGGANGLASPVRDLCRRLARHGFAAAAADLYEGAAVPADATIAFSRLEPVGLHRVLTDLGRYLAAGLGPWDTKDQGFGIIAIQEGAVWGVRTANEFGSPLVLMAPNLREISPGIGDDLQPRPAPPGVLDALPELVEPMLGLIGRDDDVVPVDDVMEARRLAPHSQWVLYDGAGHDFLDDNAVGFDQAAFTDSLQRIIDFLTKNL